MTKCCSTCQEFQNKQKRETRLQHSIPKTPWTEVGTDLFQLKDEEYLIVVDYTSNYLMKLQKR